jgi:hypothetical protein
VSGYSWAAGLIVGGVLILLFNLDLLARFEPLVQYAVAALFVLASLGFWTAYARNRRRWEHLIPAWTLLALAAMVFLSTLPAVHPRVTTSLLFGGLAIAFGHIYWLDRGDRWWAIIPAGFLLVLGVVIALSSTVASIQVLGAALFLGMGAVFFLLYALTRAHRQWWSLIPGGVLMLFGLFVLPAEGGQWSALARWWPLLLLVLGGWTGWQTYRQAGRVPGSQAAVGLSGEALPRPDELATTPGVLGEYSAPAPGASIEILPDPDDDPSSSEELSSRKAR